jgi:hypothetical protein
MQSSSGYGLHIFSALWRTQYLSDIEFPLCCVYKVRKAILPMLVVSTEFIGLWALRTFRRIKFSCVYSRYGLVLLDPCYHIQNGVIYS